MVMMMLSLLLLLTGLLSLLLAGLCLLLPTLSRPLPCKLSQLSPNQLQFSHDFGIRILFSRFAFDHFTHGKRCGPFGAAFEVAQS